MFRSMLAAVVLTAALASPASAEDGKYEVLVNAYLQSLLPIAPRWQSSSEPTPPWMLPGWTSKKR